VKVCRPGGERQTILLSLGTVRASGAKKLSRAFTILGSGGALAACVVAAANAGTASTAQATAIFFLKVFSSRGAHTLGRLEALDVFDISRRCARARRSPPLTDCL
jgi:hypothetical protein